MAEKYKKAIINLKNNDGYGFQYALIVASNYQNIKKDPQIISKIKPFIDQYDWKEINFPPNFSKDSKKFELNNKTIAFIILFVPYNTEKKNLHTSQNIILSTKIKYFF